MAMVFFFRFVLGVLETAPAATLLPPCAEIVQLYAVSGAVLREFRIISLFVSVAVLSSVISRDPSGGFCAVGLALTK